MPCLSLFLLDKLSQGNICSVHMLVRAHLAYEKKRKMMHDRNQLMQQMLNDGEQQAASEQDQMSKVAIDLYPLDRMIFE